MILVYITCKDAVEAKSISKLLLKKKLVACTNYHSVKSMYRWKGKIVQEGEVVLLAKTESKYYSAIKKEVTKIHSYEIPCILRIKVDANTPYLDWVRGELDEGR